MQTTAVNFLVGEVCVKGLRRRRKRTREGGREGGRDILEGILVW